MKNKGSSAKQIIGKLGEPEAALRQGGTEPKLGIMEQSYFRSKNCVSISPFEPCEYFPFAPSVERWLASLFQERFFWDAPGKYLSLEVLQGL